MGDGTNKNTSCNWGSGNFAITYFNTFLFLYFCVVVSKVEKSPFPPLLFRQSFNVWEVAALSFSCPHSPHHHQQCFLQKMEHRVQKAERIWRWIIELDAGSGDWSESQFDGEKNSWRRFVFSPFRAENHPSQADVFIRFIRMDTQHKKLSETWCDWFWKAICGQTVGHLVPIWETPAAQNP